MTAPKYPLGVIEIEPHTPNKPEILAIAAELGIEPDSALGSIVRVWSWFTQHTADGVAPVTPDTIDAALGRPGLAAAMIAVGWLRYHAGELSIPEFNRHCRPRIGARSADQRRADRLANRRGGDSSDSDDQNTGSANETPHGRTARPESTPESVRRIVPAGPDDVNRGNRDSAPVSIRELIPATGPGSAPSPGRQRADGGPAPSTGRTGPGITGISKLTGRTGTGNTARDFPNYLQRVGVRDLLDVGALDNLLAALCRDAPIDGLHRTDQSLRLLVGAAVRALEVGTKPPALFASIVGGRRWELITAEQDDAAAEHVRRWKSTGDGTFAAGKYPKPTAAAAPVADLPY